MQPMRMWCVCAAVAVAWPLLAADARAQDAGQATEPATVLIGVEAQRDRFRYHFDNPSSIDTAASVPHFFEQTYVADNLWLVTTARYTAGVRWETSVATALPRTGRADDYDTFFDPNNVVVVAGTTGDASMRSFRISQRVELGSPQSVQLSIGYRLRWDRFDFQLGHKTITSNGALIAASDTTAPEMTDSKVHEVLFGLRAAPALGGGWHLAMSGEMSPTALARLSVQLPEKYPGQDLVFLAQVATASGRLALVHAGGRWPVECAVQLGHTWSYRSTAQLSRAPLSVTLSAGRAW
jgi:hypothetical protein